MIKVKKKSGACVHLELFFGGTRSPPPMFQFVPLLLLPSSSSFVASSSSSSSSVASSSSLATKRTKQRRTMTSSASIGRATTRGEDYAKYTHYPAYCSTPGEMRNRAVPPLREDGGDGKLVHVAAVIRHGARTPWSGPPDVACWEGYRARRADTSVWDCDLFAYAAPPPPSSMLDFMFEKRYDAHSTKNALNGTCQLGQLLSRGYDQEITNGRILRNAYLYDDDDDDDGNGNGAKDDPRMRLWDTTTTTTTTRAAVGDMTKPIYHESNLYYRADDEQRTLMSGQILLRGLFEKELLIGDHAAAADTDNDGSSSTAIIRLHTADYANDILTPNPRLCPNTFNLFKSAYTSDEYMRWIEHERVEINTIDEFIKSNMKLTNGVGAMGNMIDCMMTTICTDRTLPSYINDYDGTLGPTMFYYNTDDDEEDTTTTTTAATPDNVDTTTTTNHNSNMFERIINLAVKNFTFAYKYNNGAFPKLGMGPLWYEIMSNILPIVNPPTKDGNKDPPPPKFALFSGHDTTLMPLLASLGDKVWSGLEWAPYASMILIEIHEMSTTTNNDHPSGYAFRLLYNGEVLTSRIEGCNDDSDLCDSRILVERVGPFAKRYEDLDCGTSSSASTSTTTVTTVEDKDFVSDVEKATKAMVMTPGGIWELVLLILFSMILGMLLMWLHMRKVWRKYEHYQQRAVEGNDSSLVVCGESQMMDKAEIRSTNTTTNEGLFNYNNDMSSSDRRRGGNGESCCNDYGSASGIDMAISTEDSRRTTNVDGKLMAFSIDENEII